MRKPTQLCLDDSILSIADIAIDLGEVSRIRIKRAGTSCILWRLLGQEPSITSMIILHMLRRLYEKQCQCIGACWHHGCWM